MRRRTFLTVSGEGIKASKTVAGDILLFNKTTQQLFITPNDEFDDDLYPLYNYTPVGVVVVPGTHNVYGDGSCAVMSLKGMNCNTPITGSEEYQKMYWGQYGTDISSLKNYTSTVYIGSNGNVTNKAQGCVDITSNVYLPTDDLVLHEDRVENPFDDNTDYLDKGKNKTYIPSPYLTNGTRNSVYYQTSSPSSTINAMSDFDGRGNTDKILKQRGTKDYSSWKPKYYSQEDYPAASCCDMYYTDGTKQGDWYLPAIGELGYVASRIAKIYYAIRDVTYSNSSNLEVGYRSLLSSTEYSENYSLYITDVSFGQLSLYSKWYDGSYVRAFMRVK